MGTGAGSFSFGATKGFQMEKNKFESEETLKNELRRNNIKFNEEDIQFIVRDKTGQIVWLESGNNNAGLKHILDGKDGNSGHAKDFERAYGIKRDEVSSFLKNVLTEGTIVSNQLHSISGGKLGYERIYKYQGNYYTLVGIGTNGFIVSAYPISKEDV